MIPSSEILQLNTDAIDLLHRNSMHPCYKYRMVMISPDTKDPTEANIQPIPSTETGWERNYLGDNKTDPDIWYHSWRKMIDGEVLNAMATLRERSMHRDTAVALLRQHAITSRNGVTFCTLPLRRGEILLDVEPSGHALKPNLFYRVRLKSGEYTERCQWMPFLELSLTEEDFHFVFAAEAENFVRLHLQFMLGALFPEHKFDIMIERKLLRGVAYANAVELGIKPRADRETHETITLWVRYDNHAMLVWPVDVDFTNVATRHEHVAIISKVWEVLGEKKVEIYEKLERHISVHGE